jgi:hypothetical protein
MSRVNTGHPSAVLDSYYRIDLDETKRLVATGALNLYGGVFENNHSAAVYVQFFNKAAEADVTLGTTTPDWTLMLPASGAVVLDSFEPLKHFNLGLVVACTAGRTNAVAPGADATVTILFRKNI